MGTSPRAMGEEVQLFASKKEKEHVEHLGDLYAIFRTTDKLERAFIGDHISAGEYETACGKLITQYRTLRNILERDGLQIPQFVEQYSVQCPYAEARFAIGVPATLEHGLRRSEAPANAAAVGQVTEEFISTIDHLEMASDCSVDALMPDVQALLNHLRGFALPPDSPIRQRLLSWQVTLDAKGATYELTEDEYRRLKYDVNQCYTEFKDFLQRGGA